MKKSNDNNKQIVGFRKVRGRIVPITYAQAAAPVLGSAAVLMAAAGATGHNYKKILKRFAKLTMRI